MTQPATMSSQQLNQLRRTFRKDLKAPVKLLLITRTPSPISIPGRDCPSCAQTRQLLEEVAAASPKLELEVIDFYGESQAAGDLSVARIPAILIGSDDPPRMVFYGIPLAHQMAAIVETIRAVSRGTSSLQNDTRRQLRRINRQMRMQVMVTPEDQASAEAAYLAFAMARESSCLYAEAVQLRDFPTLARSLGIQGVPTVILNDFHRLTAPVNESTLVERIMLAAGPESS